ncbi:MAG: glutamine synthetase III [Negativibacillus massiliensis]|uniref:glutamine synthetase III family protein n=1 Tax=Negativibacillus massiliensis TaxID=1871035 RepID=UPI0039A159E2
MNIEEIFGIRVFDDAAMRKRLPERVYESLSRTRRLGENLDPSIADVVACAMKDWAIEQGATHYSHWFQPMNNFTAGKHDAFLSTTGKDGRISLEFSSKALIKGEADSSSFPSGGLRATFEARGYTTWDPTSPAFVRDGTLFIPTAFCSYNGEALDAKTPLLRSMQAVSQEGVRLLRALGNQTVTKIIPMVGAEQEYFLVDYKLYDQRLDLKICGRTLFGAKPAKGQELDDHYCGRIRIRVGEFMQDLDKNLWEMGIASKTKHNEAAPAQHELAPEYSTANIACDHNQLIMETMRTISKKHGLACLLHEKPFANVNGSGKHNNFSLCTDTGENLLKPGKHPENNLQFLLMLCAFLRGVDLYADLLRMSAACAGNDHRLGGCEAPPPIISIFLGHHLTNILDKIANGSSPEQLTRETMNVGVDAIPEFLKDETDRNRTSPFAFTGNKFEFRMVGSSQSLAYSEVVLNTILADSFHEFALRLEQADNVEDEIRRIITDTMHDHKRIIYNGNNYSQDWVEEAIRRGLPILKSSADAFRTLIDPKNIDLFDRYHVFSPKESSARYEIQLENYIHVIQIEASTMLEIAKRQIIPSCIKYSGKIAQSLHEITACGMTPKRIQNHLETVTESVESIMALTDELERILNLSTSFTDPYRRAQYMAGDVCDAMARLRARCDALETIVNQKDWPMPTYTDLLHRI